MLRNYNLYLTLLTTGGGLAKAIFEYFIALILAPVIYQTELQTVVFSAGIKVVY
jgi:hypothetical protein